MMISVLVAQLVEHTLEIAQRRLVTLCWTTVKLTLIGLAGDRACLISLELFSCGHVISHFNVLQSKVTSYTILAHSTC